MKESIHASLTMTRGEWRLRLAELCQASAQAQPDQEAEMLRMARGLLANHPDPRSSVGDHLPPLAVFDALLALGAYDSAAVALMPQDGSYIVSRAGEGGCMASVMLPGMDEEMTSEADISALALVSALAAALASGADAGAEAAMWTPMAAGRGGDAAGDTDDWHRPCGTVLH